MGSEWLLSWFSVRKCNHIDQQDRQILSVLQIDICEDDICIEWKNTAALPSKKCSGAKYKIVPENFESTSYKREGHGAGHKKY